MSKKKKEAEVSKEEPEIEEIEEIEEVEEAPADDETPEVDTPDAVEAEEVHAKLYTQALEAAKAGKDLDVDFYLCPVCGYIEFGQAPDNCPICGAKGSKFIKG